jgi:acyl-CoA dehydrogenase
MIDGRWSGTMNLTEPHCGTDLGLIRTRAEPAGDGSHRITGQKIWISAGEHDLTENIIHLVLARLPGAPEGVKGISLFLVPKFLPDAVGTPGVRNRVACIGLERKMGIHANATCVMQYDGAQGWLVGDPHKGMRAMFTMMNEARMGVGLQGLAVAAAAHQQAAAFARDRLQGRAPGVPASPGAPADPIVAHPDVRRMLMDQRAFVEGGRALVLWAAMLNDKAHRGHDAQAGALVSLLTPVIKAFLTERGFAVAVDAQQVPGGAGYTRAAGFEQFVRDARIAMIYEGTNGIQALDLVGRKLGAEGGRAIMAFFATVKALVAEDTGDEALRTGFLDPLKAASRDLETAALWLAEHGAAAPEDALAGAHDFLHLFGHTCLGLMWTRMAIAATAALKDGGREDAAFLRAKLVTGRHYMARHLPATALHLARIRAGGETVMALGADAF